MLMLKILLPVSEGIFCIYTSQISGEMILSVLCTSWHHSVALQAFDFFVKAYTLSTYLQSHQVDRHTIREKTSLAEDMSTALFR
jgi:hypothetical protein